MAVSILGRWDSPPAARYVGPESAPAISPDGRWIAYAADLSGSYEVYVERFPDLGARRRVSTAGGHYPVWSHGGRELFYVEGDFAFTFDIHPDDRRFPMVKPLSGDGTVAKSASRVLVRGRKSRDPSGRGEEALRPRRGYGFVVYLSTSCS